MQGYNSIHEFIVSQAPLDTTVDDHWRMIWEYNCLAIVMLTKSIENGRVKCNHYWPYDREPMFYNDLKVQIVRETVDLKHTNPEYIITYMTLSQGEELRLIKHFHYLAWPEDGLPDNPESVIHFTKLVRTFLAYDSPTVVHCSSGIGRSGIFILIDRLFQTITEHDEEQYIFIHKCLVFELECGNNADKELYPETDEGNIYLNIVMGKEESQTDEHIQVRILHEK
ncbi:hypothetical protein LSH36_261g03003 [Paralvinella palmiformis]|uniref:Uncharacterized protein n=1 Tax=Paralvinella palmiformis TaxID=53620 RepID=A0AAD9N2F6_9ANNE|nr:hypothetical protein LSH36_261g03003 [Paralvinella palmiformis]